MTVHDLHDALNLLPGDLVTATDKLRTGAKPKVVQWKRWVSLAAALALVISTGWVFQQKIMPGKGTSSECAAEAPAAMAPAENGVSGDTAVTEAAAGETPAEDNASSTSRAEATDEKAAQEELCIDHSHTFAEEANTVENPVSGYCGNTMAWITGDGETHTLAGSDAIAITDILTNLDYDPDEVCRCAAEVTVDTEMLTGIQVSTAQGFARCEKGQAALTEEQAKTIQEIIDRLQ